MRRPTKTQILASNLYIWVRRYGCVDISPGMEKYLCVSRRVLLSAAKKLCEDPADLKKVMILRIDGITVLVMEDSSFSLSDFDLRLIPKDLEGYTNGNNS